MQFSLKPDHIGLKKQAASGLIKKQELNQFHLQSFELLQVSFSQKDQYPICHEEIFSHEKATKLWVVYTNYKRQKWYLTQRQSFQSQDVG